VKNSISKYFSNKWGLILCKIKFVFVLSIKFLHKKMLAQEKASSWESNKIGGAGVRFCVGKNNYVTLQVN